MVDHIAIRKDVYSQILGKFGQLVRVLYHAQLNHRCSGFALPDFPTGSMRQVFLNLSMRLILTALPDDAETCQGPYLRSPR